MPKPLKPPSLDAHLFKARCKLVILSREFKQPAALVGVALEVDRAPGEARSLAILLGGWVQCGFVLVHANYQVANRLKNA